MIANFDFSAETSDQVINYDRMIIDNSCYVTIFGTAGYSQLF